MAGGLQFDPPAQFFRKADTDRISGSENGFLPRRSGLINGGTSPESWLLEHCWEALGRIV